MARVHQDLKRLLKSLGGGASSGAQAALEPIEVVVQLSVPEDDTEPTPESVRRIAADTLQRVGALVHEDPADYNVFPNLQSLVVRASPGFIRKLLEQPEVLSALSNRPSRRK